MTLGIQIYYLSGLWLPPWPGHELVCLETEVGGARLGYLPYLPPMSQFHAMPLPSGWAVAMPR